MPQKARILLVDDRAENLIALEAILSSLNQELVPVRSGEAALKALLSDEFAVILLDVVMPGMDGFETAAHIKNRARTHDVPIIFLTAAGAEPDHAFRGYAAGAVDYIAKPFDPWVLRAKVSVFVDLYTKNRQLREQSELLRQQAEGSTGGLLRASCPGGCRRSRPARRGWPRADGEDRRRAGRRPGATGPGASAGSATRWTRSAPERLADRVRRLRPGGRHPSPVCSRTTFAGHARHHAPVGHLAADHRAGRDHHVAPDPCAGQHDRPGAQPGAGADRDRRGSPATGGRWARRGRRTRGSGR